MKLWKKIVNNVEKLRKKDAQINNGNSPLYKLEIHMSVTTAFENYLVLEDAAKECTEQLEVKFQEFSKALQKDILPSRPSAEEKFLKLLTNYKRQECHKMDKLLG